MSVDQAARQLGRQVSELERIAAASARRGKTPERSALERIAIESAADAREALRVFRDRGDEAAGAERDYRKVQLHTSELLAHLKATGITVTPEPDAYIWKTWPVIRRADGEPYPPPADASVGEMKTAKQFEVALNALCADARYERDTKLHRSRSAGKAIAMFDRIINLMQSLMRTDALEDRIDGADIPWEDEEP